MVQEDKQLLFKDLCARLPYGVRCKVWIKDGTTEEGSLDLQHNYGDVLRDAFYYNKIVNLKPYLRPISSMTDEEFNSLKEETALNYNNQLDLVDWNNGCKTLEFWLKEIPSYVAILVFDWLNSHHFDYRALIDRKLALEAPEGMYN